MQALGSKYGSRQCSGTVDFGFVVFDVDDDGQYTWWCEFAELKTQKTVVEKLQPERITDGSKSKKRKGGQARRLAR